MLPSLDPVVNYCSFFRLACFKPSNILSSVGTASKLLTSYKCVDDLSQLLLLCNVPILDALLYVAYQMYVHMNEMN